MKFYYRINSGKEVKKMNNFAKVDKKDILLMQLAHYFITIENYTPIIVKGVQNEIWLENIEAPYKIIRINANYLHNNEQLDFDMFKIRNIVKQVKKKTLSFSVKTLNILIDVGSTVKPKKDEKIDSIFITSNKDLENNKTLNSLYPDLKNNLVDTTDGVQFILDVTNDINQKTHKDTIEYERVFRKKKNIITMALMAINILVFIISSIGTLTDAFDLPTLFALNRGHVQSGEIYRLLTSTFMHTDIFHLIMNMYALYIIGSQVESYIGKKKYLIIYLISGIMGSLLSCVVNTSNTWSLGASGAIFGLMGTLLFFGYHYRLYLDSALKNQIIPLIILNLAIGFIVPNIDNGAHIGGLVGGLFASMALGIENKSSKSDSVNGVICSIILFGVLVYLLFFAS